MNFDRYSTYPPMNLYERTWPDKIITKSPIWCSVDLRDGNQAMSVPMGGDAKLAMFEMLVEVGFKEIEVAFPSASPLEYRFVRKLIEEERIPEDVTIQVLTPARETLIRKTFEAIKGACNVIVSMYCPLSTEHLEIVMKKSRDDVKRIAVDGAKVMSILREAGGNSGLRFKFTPESFMGAEPEYALEVCEAVIDVWRPTPDNKVIINLPATVEMCTPNIYADRVEWFGRRNSNRDSIIIGVHTHNDRGTAVAAAELAVMAGAERVEGTLFGSGERAGNMDVITMAMNLFSQGVDPELDFSQIDYIKKTFERCMRMKVHPRHPYAGKLVYTAFSGAHQDAIHKGMRNQETSIDKVWAVPYLPIDPKDVGRDYEPIIRINSQSGRSGAAYVLWRKYGINVPEEMLADFGKAIKAKAESLKKELSPKEILECMNALEYIRK